MDKQYPIKNEALGRCPSGDIEIEPEAPGVKNGLPLAVLVCGLLIAGVFLPERLKGAEPPHPAPAKAEEGAQLRIGAYDSRSVAVSFAGSRYFQETWGAEMGEEH